MKCMHAQRGLRQMEHHYYSCEEHDHHESNELKSRWLGIFTSLQVAESKRMQYNERTAPELLSRDSLTCMFFCAWVGGFGSYTAQ